MYRDVRSVRAARTAKPLLALQLLLHLPAPEQLGPLEHFEKPHARLTAVLEDTRCWVKDRFDVNTLGDLPPERLDLLRPELLQDRRVADLEGVKVQLDLCQG